MAIRIQHGDLTYLADTPEEAAKLGALLKLTDARGHRSVEELDGQHAGIIAEMAAAAATDQFEWTPELFGQYMDRLGEPQKAVLALIVEGRSVSDRFLREMLNISGNQSLAGTLSGISKQAAALSIPPRAVFTFENRRKAGKRQSVYYIADGFRKITGEMEWPKVALR